MEDWHIGTYPTGANRGFFALRRVEDSCPDRAALVMSAHFQRRESGVLPHYPDHTTFCSEQTLVR